MAQNMTVIKKCKGHCKHDFQDKRYGKGKRVMNYSSKNQNYRCTVCGTVQ